ncbi:TetR/AcrR family transcriptional regulator [Pseudonocardia sp. CA-107938]|uniref:TetR/AcrR family transcriptional regulator n=1 Tax=Pseudonocardia sp. CA-107938 TaxID=3240021 RepID=UPI003D8FEEF4
MPRSSRAETARHHDQIVDAASRLFRERGVDGVGVPEVMAAAGLTHGGFYRHFPSKDALAAAAVHAAFAQRADRLRELHEEHGGDPAATRAAFVEQYLSSTHRDAPERGCPNAALAVEIARSEPGSAVRAAYGPAVRDSVARIAELAEQGADQREREDAALRDLAALVGAVVLARATAGDEISDRVLAAVREGLL